MTNKDVEMLIRANKLLIRGGSKLQCRDKSYNIIHRLRQAFDKSESTPLPYDKDKIVSLEIARHLFLIKIIKEIERHYQNSILSVEFIATNIAVSERQIYRIFKDYLNIPPASFIKIYRLEKALLFIKRGETLGNIAFLVGFSSHSYFSHCFKSRFGKTPTEFIKSLNNKTRQDFNNHWQSIDNGAT